jgi:pimeloyl-ACP methyl ester carboxylesterase
MLLHGLAATASINWRGAFDALGPEFRVVALDHRGHGRGIQTRRFSLRDCADDVVALADVLGIDRFIAVGYSMGGPIALLARRRHPSRVNGLVLCATSAQFPRAAAPAPLGAAVVAAARLAPLGVRRRLVRTVTAPLVREAAIPPAILTEARRHDPAALLEAGRAIGRFDARTWVGRLDCPTASVITDRDRLVPPYTQLALAETARASVHPVAGDHGVVVRAPGRFYPALVEACRSVADRQRAAADVAPALLSSG